MNFLYVMMIITLLSYLILIRKQIKNDVLDSQKSIKNRCILTLILCFLFIAMSFLHPTMTMAILLFVFLIILAVQTVRIKNANWIMKIGGE